MKLVRIAILTKTSKVPKTFESTYISCSKNLEGVKLGLSGDERSNYFLIKTQSATQSFITNQNFPHHNAILPYRISTSVGGSTLLLEIFDLSQANMFYGK